MNKKNLLITSGLISVIIVLIGVFIIIPTIANTSTAISNPTTANADNPTTNPAAKKHLSFNKTPKATIPNPTTANADNPTTNPATKKYLSFDNKTPEATAVSIARLNEGEIGFCIDNTITASASLTSDGKYWIVSMHEDGGDDWVVTIDAKTLMSKKNGGTDPVNTWRSLDELKSRYIAEIQSGDGMDIGRPYKVTLEGKLIWKVPVYDLLDNGRKLNGYIYVDLATGKSKDFDCATGKEGKWLTLKEVDKSINEMYNFKPGESFRDALRDLYRE